MRSISVVLASLIALPPSLLATPLAVLEGSVTSVQGSALAGVELGLVDLDTGRVVPARSDGTGAIRTRLDAGIYAVDSGRFQIVGGPRIVRASAGATVALALTLAPAEQARVAEAGLTIDHAPVGCIVAEHPALLEAVIGPAERVTGARVLYRSALAGVDSFVEMTGSGGRFTGRLPSIGLEAKRITYSIEATSSLGARRTQEATATVVKDPGECRSRMAEVLPGGPALGPGAGAGGLGTTGLIVAGALVAGAVAVIVATRGNTPPPASPSR